jgi:hypothetical protein
MLGFSCVSMRLLLEIETAKDRRREKRVSSLRNKKRIGTSNVYVMFKLRRSDRRVVKRLEDRLFP